MTGDARGPSDPDRMAWFACLWGASELVHQWTFANHWLVWLAVTLLAASAVVNPRSLKWLALLSLASTVDNLLLMPLIVNHMLFTVVANATIFLAISICAARPPASLPPAEGELRSRVWCALAPILRAQWIAWYALAALQKLNRDFFDPAVSCGSVLLDEVAAWLPIVPTGNWARVFSIWYTIGMELLLPLLLAVPRWRTLGIALAVPFHFLLGLHPLPGVHSFSALAYAMLFTFADDRLFGALSDVVRPAVDALGRRPRLVQWVGGPFLVALTMCCFIAWAAVGWKYCAPLVRATWLSLAGVVMAVTALALLRLRPTEAASQPRAPRWAAWLGAATCALLTFNGLCPFLGLKTESTFGMFSNLRTEGGRPNHLFLPASIGLAGYQEDLIEIIDSDVPAFRNRRDQGKLMVAFEFQRLCGYFAAGPYDFLRGAVFRRRADFFVTYRRRGEVATLRVVAGASSDPELTRPLPWWPRKLLWFRDVDAGGPARCCH